MNFQTPMFNVQSNHKSQLPILEFGILILIGVWTLSIGIFTPRSAEAAIIYSQSANQDIYEDQTFVLDWFLDTEGKSVNTLDLKIKYSRDLLEVVEANAGNSLINLWIKQPTVNLDTGSIELVGGIPNGVNAKQIPIFRTVFKAIKTGTASISINSNSLILLNDGVGNSESIKFKDVLFNIYPDEFLPLSIESSSHPNQDIWYSKRDVNINFSPKADTDYSYSFSSNIDMIPDDEKDQVPELFSYSSQPDGIYYFKVNSKVGPSTWQEAGVYRIQIDGTAPESFVPKIGADPGIFQGDSFVSFSTVDKTSGISHYYIKSGLFGVWKSAVSPAKLEKPLVGKHIKIAAFDNAGNKRVETIEYKGWIPVWLFVVIIVLVLIGLFFLLRVLRRILMRKYEKQKN